MFRDASSEPITALAVAGGYKHHTQCHTDRQCVWPMLVCAHGQAFRAAPARGIQAGAGLAGWVYFGMGHLQWPFAVRERGEIGSLWAIQHASIGQMRAIQHMVDCIVLCIV